MMSRQILCALSTLLAAVSLSLDATALASMPAVNRFTEGVAAIQGVWYDLDGNESLVIDGTSFNGRKILGAFSFERGRQVLGAEFSIQDEKGENASRVSISWTPSHRFLIVDGKTYRSTKKPEYFESVHGVFLGMKKEDALALLGEPAKNVHNWKFIYPDMTLYTTGGIVVALLLPGGGARLDRSGLGADDAPEDFAEAYDFQEEWNGQDMREIFSYGEYLQRRQDMIILSLSVGH